jgi:hypothetical protein
MHLLILIFWDNRTTRKIKLILYTYFHKKRVLRNNQKLGANLKQIFIILMPREAANSHPSQGLNSMKYCKQQMLPYLFPYLLILIVSKSMRIM